MIRNTRRVGPERMPGDEGSKRGGTTGKRTRKPQGGVLVSMLLLVILINTTVCIPRSTREADAEGNTTLSSQTALRNDTAVGLSGKAYLRDVYAPSVSSRKTGRSGVLPARLEELPNESVDGEMVLEDETAWPITLTQAFDGANGAHYTVAVTFDEDADILQREGWRGEITPHHHVRFLDALLGGGQGRRVRPGESDIQAGSHPPPGTLPDGGYPYYMRTL